jgi:hypothetical protein
MPIENVAVFPSDRSNPRREKLGKEFLSGEPKRSKIGQGKIGRHGDVHKSLPRSLSIRELEIRLFLQTKLRGGYAG